MVVLNPFAADIDLTTDKGQKMWNIATAGSEKKFNLTNDPTNAENFKQAIDEAFKKYCWRSAVNAIPVTWDDAGNPAKVVNVMSEFRQITEVELCTGTGTRFDCTFDADEIHHNLQL